MAVRKCIAIALLALSAQALADVTLNPEGTCYTAGGAPTNSWWEFQYAHPTIIVSGPFTYLKDNIVIMRCFTNAADCNAARISIASQPAGSQGVGSPSAGTFNYTWGSLSTACLHVN